jgi:tetratricopeptide (TPR) repeat protein
MGIPGSRRARWAAGVVLAALVAGALVWYRTHRSGGPVAPTPAELEREAAAHAHDPERLLAVGERLRRLGEARPAYETILRAFEQRERDPRFAAAMVEALLDTGQLQEAFSLAEEAQREHPDSGAVAAAQADVWLKAGRADRALTLAHRAVEREPESPRAWRVLARVAAANHLPAEAWPAFQRAQRLAPDDLVLQVDCGEALAREGRAREAEAALRRALAGRPPDARALTLLGALLAGRARTGAEQEEAIALLRQAAARPGAATEPRYQLGRALLQAGDAAGAVPPLEEALRLDPSFGEVWLPLGQAYQAAGRAADARVAFDAYERFSRLRREAAHLQLRLRQAPGQVDLLLRLARLEEASGRREQALSHYQEALRLRPDPGLARHVASLAGQAAP